MSSSICLRSFSQLSLDRATHASLTSRTLLASQAACFSTSSARYANPNMKKKTLGAAPKRGTKTLNVKKGRKDPSGKDSGKRPNQGDRKAQRKRIVLSNNNALEVSSLKDLTKADVLSESIEGQVKGIPGEVVDALRTVEAFKTSQGWGLFRRPAVLVRKETTQLAKLVKEVEDSKQKQTGRLILSGERKSGKSTLLLQGLTMALLRNWVVINLPNAWDIVSAYTEYGPVPNTKPMQYSQDTYTANLLQQTLKANATIFESTKLTTNPTLPLPLPSNATLKDLAQLGAANPDVSWPVFVALWKELTQADRPPIMLALDGLSHIMGESAYLSADVKPIHAFDLTLVRHFVDHLSGKESLPNGGIILGANSLSNNAKSPALEHSIQVAEAHSARIGIVPAWNAYKKTDERVMAALRNVPVLKVGGLTKDEARAIMEYYAESGMLRAKVNDNFVSEKWSVAGMGNIGELERATVRLKI